MKALNFARLKSHISIIYTLFWHVKSVRLLPQYKTENSIIGCPTEKVEVCKTNSSRWFRTLGKIETTPQIGYALGKVRDNAILNHTCKYKKRLRDQYHAGALAEM